ncbi:putative two-component sensor [Streptomyces sp. Tu6071]|nr:putative two-component sensor [Streptomyces sp. Tu6071]
MGGPGAVRHRGVRGRGGLAREGPVALLEVSRQRHGQHKSEAGAAARGPADRDPAAVHLDDALHDVEAETGAAALGAAPEAGEDTVHRLLGDALPLVAHRDHGPFRSLAARRGRDVDGDSTAAVAHRVFQEVAQDLVDFVGIGPQRGQRAAHGDDEAVAGAAGRDVRLHVPRRRARDVHGLAPQLHAARVDAGDVEEFRDEPRDAMGVGVDGLQHEPLLVVVEPLPLGEERRREALHGGERGAQFVRDGRDQLGVTALRAAPRSGVAQRDDEPDQRPARARAHVLGRDEDLAAPGEEQVLLRLPGPDGEAPVRVGEPPPAPPVEVFERQHVLQRAPERGLGKHPGDARRRGVEARHDAACVRDDESVRQVVGPDGVPFAGHGDAARRDLVTGGRAPYPPAPLPRHDLAGPALRTAVRHPRTPPSRPLAGPRRGWKEPPYRGGGGTGGRAVRACGPGPCPSPLSRPPALGARRGVEADRGGRREVEGLGLAVQRDADDRVGEGAGLLGQAPRLVAEDPRGGAAHRAAVEFVVEVVGARAVGGQDPYPDAAQPRDGLLDGHAGDDGQVEERTDRGAHALGVVDVHRGVGEDHGVGAGGVRAAQHRTGVAGIADVREDGDEAGTLGEDVGEAGVEEAAQPDDALRGHGVGHRGEHLLTRAEHRDAPGARVVEEFGVAARGVLGRVHLDEVPRGLPYGLRALGQEAALFAAEAPLREPSRGDDAGGAQGGQLGGRHVLTLGDVRGRAYGDGADARRGAPPEHTEPAGRRGPAGPVERRADTRRAEPAWAVALIRRRPSGR